MMIMQIEHVILRNLFQNDEYARKVLPFLKEEYFHNEAENNVFKKVHSYIVDHNSLPTSEAIKIELDDDPKIGEVTYDEAVKELDSIIKKCVDEPSMSWLTDKTESFCKDMALHNAVMDAISILEGENKKVKKEAIPEILSEALGVSFDPNIGHDYLKDYIARYNYYHDKKNKIPFDIELLNTITKGGLDGGTLTVIIAGTHVGKSLIMGHMAGYNLVEGKNVLYITLEMGEEEIAERIDARLLDIPMDDVRVVSKKQYTSKVEALIKQTQGRLIIKQFPTAGAGCLAFKHLLNELALKEDFIPHIIYVDYLNICTSDRIGKSGSYNSYEYMKNVAEELRGLSIQAGVPLVTATQVNREGFKSSDFGLDNTAESFGVPMTADLMLAVISSDELKKLGQFKIKQLKNRLGDIGQNTVFVVGVDTQKMKIYDVDDNQQTLIDETAIMDKGKMSENEGFTAFDFEE